LRQLRAGARCLGEGKSSLGRPVAEALIGATDSLDRAAAPRVVIANNSRECDNRSAMWDWEPNLGARVQFAISCPLLVIAFASLAVADTQLHCVLYHTSSTDSFEHGIRFNSLWHAFVAVGFCISFRLDPKRFFSRSLAICAVAITILFPICRLYSSRGPWTNSDGLDQFRAQLGIPLESRERTWLYLSQQLGTQIALALIAAACAIIWLKLRSSRTQTPRPTNEVQTARRRLTR
jgi:hypothetical protein